MKTRKLVVYVVAYDAVTIEIPEDTDLEDLPDKYYDEALEKIKGTPADWAVSDTPFVWEDEL